MYSYIIKHYIYIKCIYILNELNIIIHILNIISIHILNIIIHILNIIMTSIYVY